MPVSVPATAQLRALLKAAGQRVTPARLAVLATLTEAAKPLSAAAVMRQVQRHNFDQATVYRTLSMLKEAGLIRHIDFQQGHARYELSGREEHHHIICTHCERVEDVRDCCAESMESLALKQSGFAAVLHHSLEFFGVCERCAATRT